MIGHKHQAKIRKAFLDRIDLWRFAFSPHDFQELHSEPQVRSIVEELLHSPHWETKRRDYHFVLTERFITQKSSIPYIVFVPSAVRLLVNELPHKTCFLGCRYKNPHKIILERNLKRLLSCYGFHLETDDTDLEFNELFGRVVKKIKSAALCIFDAKYTFAKPNVFIECGISFATNKLTILTVPHTPQDAQVPSDFQGLVRVPYASYHDLLNLLGLHLPSLIMKRLKPKIS